jgi:FkbM family methyltransferase
MRRRGIRAIAFEANPYNFERFRNEPHLASSGVEYLHMAVSKQDGAIDFHVQKTVAGEPVAPVRGNNSTLLRNRDGVEYETVSVPCTSLSGFFKKNGLFGLTFSAWIDVEGAVGDVLDGVGNAFDKCYSVLVEVEQHRFWQRQCLVGDVMDHFIKKNLIPIARDFEFAHQYNLIFVRRDMLDQSGVRDALAQYYTRLGRRGNV